MSTLTWDNAAATTRAGEAAPQEKTPGGKIAMADVVDITSQLAIMTRSGVDIASALESLASQCLRPELEEILGQMHADVMSGIRFSEALARHPQAFDGAYVATVAAGEATGKMSEILNQLALLKRSELRLRRSVTGMLIYPILLASVSSLVVVALVTFVLPQFASIFEQYETPLPAITQMLLSCADELRGRWWLWGPIAIGSVAGSVYARFTPSGQRFFDRLVLESFALGRVSQKLLAGRMCRLMGLMIDSGVPLLESLQIASQSTKNLIYRDLLGSLVESVTNGKGLSESLQQSDVFPHAATEMIGAAERTGKLGEVMRMVGGYFEEEGEASAKQLVGALEPIITIGMGLVIAVVVLAVMLPVFDLASAARNGH